MVLELTERFLWLSLVVYKKPGVAVPFSMVVYNLVICGVDVTKPGRKTDFYTGDPVTDLPVYLSF